MCGGAAKDATPLRSIMSAFGQDYHPEAPKQSKPEMAAPSGKTKSEDEQAARARRIAESEESGYQSTIVTGNAGTVEPIDTKRKTILT